MAIKVYNSSGIIQQVNMTTGGNVIAVPGTTVTDTQGVVVFSNSNGVTFGIAGNTVTASAVGGGGGAALSAGTQSGNTGTIVFSNSNGISFGMAGSNTITAQHNALTTARASNDAIGLGTALTAGPLAWTANSAGLSLNAASAAGTTTGFAGNSISGSMTHNTAGLNVSLNHPAWLTTAANSTHSHGNPTLNLTNLSGTTASASNGFTLSLSAASIPAQTNQTANFYASGNTTQLSSTAGIDLRSVSFEGAGIASIGVSNGRVLVSVPSGGGGDGYNIVQAGTTGTTGTTWSSLSATVGVNGSNGIIVSQNNSNQIVLDGTNFATAVHLEGNTAGSSSVLPSGQAFHLVGGNNITLSGNGSSVTISGGAGGGGALLYRYHAMPIVSSGLYALANGTVIMAPCIVPVSVYAGAVNLLVSGPAAGASLLQPTSSASFGAGTTGSRAVSYRQAYHAALFVRGTGTNNSRIESVWSGSNSFGLSQTVSVASVAGTTLTVTNSVSFDFITQINSTGGYTTSNITGSTTVSTAASTMNSTITNLYVRNVQNRISGAFILAIPAGTTVTPGEYWLGAWYTTAVTTSVGSARPFSNMGIVGNTLASLHATVRHFNQSQTSQTQQLYEGYGAIYSASTSAVPSTIAISDMRGIHNLYPYFGLEGNSTP